MFLITSIIQYFAFTNFTEIFLVPLKNRYELKKSYEYYKVFHNVMMSLISTYMFLYGFKVYYDVKEITKSDSIYENIYSPVKIQTQSFNKLQPIILCSKYLEWIDTALIILDNKKPGLLHKFHHANIVGGFYYGSYTSSYFITGFLNSFVHIIMYLYYSKIISWFDKRYAKYITQIQIIQLGLINILSAKGMIIPNDSYDFYVTIYIEICVFINLCLFINYYKNRYLLSKP
tara:strand:- start:1445 stop:2137 length:693 start_codon:yes stop_codon:yes gene_type:complete